MVDLRGALRGAPAPAPDAGSLAESALARGRALDRRRRARRRAARPVVAGLAAFAAVAAYGAVTAPEPAALAAVSCSTSGVSLTRSTVDAGDAGARLVVTNATGDVVPLVVGDVAAFVPPGETAVDVPLPPGRVTVSCGAGAATLRVTDTHDRWTGDRVDCATPRVEDLRAVSEPVTGDPLALTEAAVGAPPGAVAEPAGYPGAADRRLVRVVHGDRVVAVAVWRALPEPGTWTLDEIRRCGPFALA
ncbi:MAG TPA: hypothetical protein VF519_09025 [Mycobacteriales bacterium]